MQKEELESLKGELRVVFGKNLEKFRESKGLSQVKLAEATGLSRSYIALLESGKGNPSLTTMLGLASAMNVSLREFIAGFREHAD